MRDSLATAAPTLTAANDDEPSTWLADVLHAAIRTGEDTDTVAVITGALAGAYCGASSIPTELRAALHGWPGLVGDDLVRLGLEV